MQLETLKIFCDVVRWASFSRGAAENGISQSSASQAVHQLEVRLGVKLIDRSKRPLVLTPQGKVYYEGCKELVDRYLELENRVKALEDEDTVVGNRRGGRDLLGRAAPHEPVRQDVRGALSGGERPARVPAPEPGARAGDQRRGRAGPALVSPEVARAERDHLARGGDGAGGPSVASVRRPGERLRSPSWTASRSSPSMPICRSGGRSTASCGITMFRSTSCSNSTTSRTSSAPSRFPRALPSFPSRHWRRRSRRGRWSRSRSRARTPTIV